MSEEGYRRRLGALLSADVEGYSLLMRDDEEATIRTVTTYRSAITNLVQKYRGHVVDAPGDNLLAEFTSVVDAVNCAVEIQREVAERNLELSENRRMRWRIGINMGDIFEDGERIYGDGVNVAARMESLAEGGGICLSGTVFDAIEEKVGLEYEFLGEQTVKNIAKPIRAYRVLSYPGAAAHRVLKVKRAIGKKWRNIGLAAAVVLVVAAVVVVWYCWLRSPSTKLVVKKPFGIQVKALPLPDKPSIAVLPFVNTSGDPKQDYIGDGITDQIIYALSKVPGIFVIARHSSFSYKGKNPKVQQVGRELGVKYVLEGNVDRAGNKLRITAQLIDTQTGRHLWAERYDRQLKDIFALQDEITLKIITSIGAKLTSGERVRVLAHGTTNVQAFLAVMKGLQILPRTTNAAFHQARQYALKAIARDPAYANAYVLLGFTYVVEPMYNRAKSPVVYWPKAIKTFKKALALDENNPDAHAYLGWVYALTRRWEKGLVHTERAIALNPGYAEAYYWKGAVLRFMSRPHEAVQEIEKAIRMNPKPPSYYYLYLAMSYAQANQFQKAIAIYKTPALQEMRGVWVHLGLGYCYYKLGDIKKARAAVAEARRRHPKFTLAMYLKLSLQTIKDREGVLNRAKILRKLGLK